MLMRVQETTVDYGHVQDRHQVIHERFDQGALFTKAVRRTVEPAWAADTQRRLLAMGLVPLSLIGSITTA